MPSLAAAPQLQEVNLRQNQLRSLPPDIGASLGGPNLTLARFDLNYMSCGLLVDGGAFEATTTLSVLQGNLWYCPIPKVQ